MEVILPLEEPSPKMVVKNMVKAINETKEERTLNAYQVEFYNRFKNYIYKVAVRVCRNMNASLEGDFWAQEIVQETFIKALAHLSSKGFNFPEDATDKHCECRIKAWLGRIANNEFQKVRIRMGNETVSIDQEDFPEPSFDYIESDEEDLEIPSEYKIKLRHAMEQLSQQDRDILITYAREGCINSTQHLSEASLKYLCETYNTTSENIRQRKKRALEKIKKIYTPENTN